MGAPIQLLGAARAFARDYARDAMPRGYLWDVVDFVPSMIDAPLQGRGKWYWGSVATGVGDVQSGIVCPFKEGTQILVQTMATLGGGAANCLQLNENPTDTASSTWTTRGPSVHSIQHPVWFSVGGVEQAVNFDAATGTVPELWRVSGAPVKVNSAHKPGRVGTVWADALFYGGAPGEEDVIRWSMPGIDLTAAGSFDANAFQPTSSRVTALQSMRSQLLVFHPSSVQRLRGGPLTNTAAGIDDSGMIFENLFERVGTAFPRTICMWNDQCIFLDEHGVNITDGATLRSLTSMGGISYFWRMAYDGVAHVSASTFLDYYIVSLRYDQTRPPPPLLHEGAGDPALQEELEALPMLAIEPRDGRVPVPPLPPDLPDVRPPPPDNSGGAYEITLVCDLNRKQWFRLSNIKCISMFAGAGSQQNYAVMDKVYASITGTARLARLAPMFYPNDGQPQVDDNGVNVLPRFETGWYRLSAEGRKRIRFAYLSYDARTFDTNTSPVRVGYLVSQSFGKDYQQAGTLPNSTGYKRLRLPINKFPYGIAFYVEAVQQVGALRIYDIGVEAQSSERSRV